MQIIKDISYLTPNAQAACRMFMEECKRRGLGIFITETYRTQERQDYLYSLGRTRSGVKVTWTRNSRHTSRRAWDIACSPPEELYDCNILKKCGEVAKSLGITWGGEWSTPDYPHFEVSVDWNAEEVVSMEQLAVIEQRVGSIDDSLTNLYSIVQRIVDKDVVYKTIEDLPEWARADIQALVDEGIIKGDGKENINLTADMVRLLVIMHRMTKK